MFLILKFLFEVFLKYEILSLKNNLIINILFKKLSVIVECSFKLILLSYDLNFFKLIIVLLVLLIVLSFGKVVQFKYLFKFTSLKLFLVSISKFGFLCLDIIEKEKFPSVFKKVSGLLFSFLIDILFIFGYFTLESLTF